MNQADILKLAEDCMIAQSYNARMNTYFASPKQLIRFAELVAQHERDEIQKELVPVRGNDAFSNGFYHAVVSIKEFITDRGEK